MLAQPIVDCNRKSARNVGFWPFFTGKTPVMKARYPAAKNPALTGKARAVPADIRKAAA